MILNFSLQLSKYRNILNLFVPLFIFIYVFFQGSYLPHFCLFEEVLKIINKKSENFDYIISRKIFKEFDYELPEEFTKKLCDKEKLITFLNEKEIKDNVISKFIKIVI